MPWLALPSLAQELEPRRWSHLPIDTNFAAGAYAYTDADIAVDPTLLIENGELVMHTVVAGYIRTFALLLMFPCPDRVAAMSFAR